MLTTSLSDAIWLKSVEAGCASAPGGTQPAPAMEAGGAAETAAQAAEAQEAFAQASDLGRPPFWEAHFWFGRTF